MNAPAHRFIGALGIVYVLATIAPAFFLPPPPPGGAAVADIARYYVDHREALLVGGWIGLLAFPVGFGYLAGLGALLAGEGKVSNWLLATAFLSISVTLAAAAVQGIIALTVPYVATSVGGAPLKVIADASQLGFSAVFPFEISYFAASGLLVLRSHRFPAWLGYSAFGVAVVALLASLGVVVRSGAFVAGGPVTLVALVVGLLWWLLAAILLVVRPRTGPLIGTT